MQPPTNNVNIGRLIALAFGFVVIFVVIAYLAYRFTRGDQGGSQPSPSPTGGSGPAVISYPSYYPPIVPPPSPAGRPVTVRRFLPTNSYVAPAVKLDNVLVAQDGQGRLLFNNLTHEENAAIKQAEIAANSRIRLAELQRQSELARQSNDQRHRLAIADLQLKEQAARLASEREVALKGLAIDEARLKSENERLKRQSDANLAQLRAQAAAENSRARLQAAEKIAVAKLGGRQALAQQITQSEAGIIAQQLENESAKDRAVLTEAGQIARSQSSERQRLTELGYQYARAEQDQKYALQLARLQAERDAVLASYQSMAYTPSALSYYGW